MSTWIVESSRLRVVKEADSQRCRPLKLVAEKNDAVPRTWMPWLGMSEMLRGASERDDGQMPPVLTRIP